ncbi:hypothetical protein UFOVP140_54 [uncultured Caudovirales phage]|uniref:Uncharacterized protein n=1 Tax=uncultured Caudovirales phage TaxID=2100421 RepID=A0A6J5LJE7_9CAUD|nr:hypothetical protein UFOVP140_54 [uncultured Caudovirales phage]
MTSAVGAWSAANGQKIALGSQASQADSQAVIAGIQGQMAVNNGETSARTAEINSSAGAKIALLNANTNSAMALMNADSVRQIAELNARMSEDNAQNALRQGERAQQNLDLKAAQVKSTQRATMAANGIDLGSATPLNILTSTDVMHASDANAIASNAIRAAFGYRTQEVNYENQATLATATGQAQSIMALANGESSALLTRTAGETAARTSRTQGSVAQLSAEGQAVGLRANASGLRFGASAINPALAAGTSLLNSASSVAMSYYQAKKLGMFDSGGDSSGGNGFSVSDSFSQFNLSQSYGMNSGFRLPSFK